MAKPEILNEVPISLVELKSELERIKKRDEELNFRANKTDEYLSQFVTLSLKKSEELREKIVKLNVPRLKDEHIVKILDVMPKTLESLKVVLQGYTLTVTQENMKKIAGVVQEFVK